MSAHPIVSNSYQEGRAVVEIREYGAYPAGDGGMDERAEDVQLSRSDLM